MIGYFVTLMGIPDLGGDLKITSEGLGWRYGQYGGLPLLPLYPLLSPVLV